MSVADETDDPVIDFDAIEQRPQVALAEGYRPVGDVLRNELTESRQHVVRELFLAGSRRLEPLELGIDPGDLVAAKSDSAPDLVVDNVAVLYQINETPKLVAGFEPRLLQPRDAIGDLVGTTATGVDDS